MSDSSTPPRRREPVDRGKLYVYGAFGGIALAIFGAWLTPFSATIGKREIDVFYILGYGCLAVGGVLALLCVLMIVLEY